MAPNKDLSQFRDAIRHAGGRITPTRVQVMELLSRTERALSHHEIEAELSKVMPIDRVTVYRVLEWLVDRGLAHRVSGEDRVWRFRTNDATHANHAHFECSRCGKVLCLENLSAEGLGLAGKLGLTATELTVRGVCAQCA